MQCFFINTIWRLLVDKWQRLPVISAAILLSVVSLGSGIATVQNFSSVQYIAESAADMKISAFVYVPSVLASDAFITATLCWILHGKRTGFRQTEMLLTKLIVYSANRGLTNLVVQVLILIMFARDIYTGHLVVLVFFLPNTTLYINTFLAVHYLRAIAFPLSGVECSLELSGFDIDMHQHGLDDQKQGDRPPAFLANDTHSRNTDQAEGSDQIYGENIEIGDVV